MKDESDQTEDPMWGSSFISARYLCEMKNGNILATYNHKFKIFDINSFDLISSVIPSGHFIFKKAAY